MSDENPITMAQESDPEGAPAGGESGTPSSSSLHSTNLVGGVVRGDSGFKKSIFLAGWRPFIGWMGGLALTYQFLLYPLLTWANKIWFPWVTPPPPLDGTVLMNLVLGVLGIAGMRSYEKMRGVDTRKL